MASKDGRSENVKTPECRLAFAAGLFETRKNEEGTKENFNCVLLFDKKTDIGVLKNLALEAAKSSWGEKALEGLNSGAIRSPFLDGDGSNAISKKSMERHPGFAGTTFLRVSSGAKFKPKVVDANRNYVYDEEGCPSGCYGKAVVNAYTWDDPKQGKGVSFGISGFQKLRFEKEDRLGGGGGIDPDEWFDKVADTDTEAAKAATSEGKGAGGLFGN